MPLSKYKNKNKKKTKKKKTKRQTYRKGKSKRQIDITKHKRASTKCKTCGRTHKRNVHRFHAKGSPRLPKVKRN